MGRSESFLGEKEKLSLDVVLLGGCSNHQAAVAMSSLATHGHILLYNAWRVLMALLYGFSFCFESEGEALHPLMEEECLISRFQLGLCRY